MAAVLYDAEKNAGNICEAPDNGVLKERIPNVEQDRYAEHMSLEELIRAADRTKLEKILFNLADEDARMESYIRSQLAGTITSQDIFFECSIINAGR